MKSYIDWRIIKYRVPFLKNEDDLEIFKTISITKKKLLLRCYGFFRVKQFLLTKSFFHIRSEATEIKFRGSLSRLKLLSSSSGSYR